MSVIIIKSYSKKEALGIAFNRGYTNVVDLTKQYNASNNSIEEFAKSVKDCGEYIVELKHGKPNTKERPYEYINCYAPGHLIKVRKFEVKTEDGTLVAVKDSKKEAIIAAKQAMNNFMQNMVCNQVYYVDDPHKTTFKLNYKPSVGTTLGEYAFFKVINE